MVGNGGNIHFDTLFIYTGKAQGIWSMFTYGGEMFHLDWEMHRSQLQTKALSVENRYYFTEIFANIRKDFFFCELV